MQRTDAAAIAVVSCRSCRCDGCKAWRILQKAVDNSACRCEDISWTKWRGLQTRLSLMCGLGALRLPEYDEGPRIGGINEVTSTGSAGIRSRCLTGCMLKLHVLKLEDATVLESTGLFKTALQGRCASSAGSRERTSYTKAVRAYYDGDAASRH